MKSYIRRSLRSMSGLEIKIEERNLVSSLFTKDFKKALSKSRQGKPSEISFLSLELGSFFGILNVKVSIRESISSLIR